MLGQLDLLLEISQLPNSLPLEVQQVTGLLLLGQIQAPIAGLGQLLPLLEMQTGIGLKHVLLLGVGHGGGEVKQLLVLLFGLEDLDLLGSFLAGLHVHRPAVLEIVELYCTVHLHH